MNRRAATGLSLAFIWCAASALAGEPPDFDRDVKPILEANCVVCHGDRLQESGLRLDSGRALLTGGNTGPAIVAGKSGESLLIRALTGAKGVVRMPPEDEAPALSAAKISLIRRWIDEGAKLPPDEAPATDRPRKKASKHWSFQPVVRPPLPTVSRADWAGSPIDPFVLQRLAARGIAPSAEADRITLIRRLHLDLIGLPPAVSDVDAFVADLTPDAYERRVDRVLASPRYGERFARQWLDQARYADSDGYSNDQPRVIWPYRDYVIDAFNADLPFDQFTIEQIAGDLLPGATPTQVTATGFHRNTQQYSEGDSATEEYRVENVVDRVHTTGVVFLGLTLGCARCHDHKFDPISQREFFELYAFFNNQDEPAETVVSGKHGKPSTTLVLRERKEPRETRIHVRGEFTRLGRVVNADVPAVLPPLISSRRPFNRLNLARWLVSAENPLTPRVAVNRMWRVLFGGALIDTDDDFGAQGDRPTHPELLDWLAAEFPHRQWSGKAMHRTLVTSATYRQASVHRDDLRTIDPQNRLWARQNRIRLDAELIRDVALSACGMLSNKMKGPSVFPPQPDGVMRLTQQADRIWTTSRGEDRYRRGLYTHFWRLTPYPLLTLFDAPEASTACTRRPRSNTPLQALALLNDAAAVEMSTALSERLQRELPRGTAEERIEYAFRLCVARGPSAAERSALMRLLASEGPAAWNCVARVLLNLDETITRE